MWYMQYSHFSLILIISFLLLIISTCATTFDFTAYFQDYPDFKQTEQFLKSIAAVYPHLVTLHALGLTAEGRTIWALQITTNQQMYTKKPQFLFTSLIHSDEWISLPVLLYTVHRLATTYQHDEETRFIVNRASLWFVPIVNPDGYVHSHSGDRNWRKNRSLYGETPAGVDINRNFAVMWDMKGGFSKDPDSRFYRGPAAASEPETRALQKLAAHVDFQAAIDFHSFGQYILYPYGYSRTQCPDNELYRQTAAAMAEQILKSGGSVYKPIQMCRIYPAALPSGTLMDYLYATYGTLAFTIELRPQTQELGGVCLEPEQIPYTCKEGFAVIKFLCRRVMEQKNSVYN